MFPSSGRFCFACSCFAKAIAIAIYCHAQRFTSVVAAGCSLNSCFRLSRCILFFFIIFQHFNDFIITNTALYIIIIRLKLAKFLQRRFIRSTHTLIFLRCSGAIESQDGGKSRQVVFIRQIGILGHIDFCEFDSGIGRIR